MRGEQYIYFSLAPAATFDRASPRPYHAPAMANPLLENVLPADLADRGQVIEKAGEVGDFERLVEAVEEELQGSDDAGRPRNWRHWPVEVALRFGRLDGEAGRPRVSGAVTTSLPLVCQRCLACFELPLEVSIDLVLVASGESGAEYADEAGSEVWELQSDTIRVADIVEEALIMALPLAPVHRSREECGPLAGRIGQDKAETARPFADLRSQMDKARE
jgi:uncharacterized protein